MANSGFTDWFSADGRLSRLQYALRTIVVTVIFMIISAFCLGSFIGVMLSTFHIKALAQTEWQSDADGDASPGAGVNISATASGFNASADGEGHFRLDTAQGEHKDVHYKIEHQPGAVVPIAMTVILSALAMGIAGLISFWIHLVAQIRRFHDIGQTGLLVLINLIPGAGFFLWLFLMLVQGQVGANGYGPDPLDSQTPSPPAHP